MTFDPSRGEMPVMIPCGHVDSVVSRCVVKDATRQEVDYWQRGEDVMRCEPSDEGPNSRARLHKVQPCAAVTTQQARDQRGHACVMWCDAMRCEGRKEID